MKACIQFRSFAAVCATVLLLGLVSGCGDGQPTGDVVKTVPAAGLLTYKGEPLKYHRVTLMPSGTGRPAVGTSDDEGKFVLGTNDAADGAIVGTHQAAVAYVGPVTGDDPSSGLPLPPPPAAVKINKKYNDPKTSGLTVTIPDGGDKELKIDLQ